MNRSSACAARSKVGLIRNVIQIGSNGAGPSYLFVFVAGLCSIFHHLWCL